LRASSRSMLLRWKPDASWEENVLLLELLALCRLLLGIPVTVVELPTELRLASVVIAPDSVCGGEPETEPDPPDAWPFLLFPLLLLPLPLPATPVGAAASTDPPTPSLGRALLLLLISFDLYESRWAA